MRRRQVVIIGTGDSGFSPDAYEIGRFIASRGWVLVSGGRGGVMESASRGAKDGGGLVVGILPGSGFEDANPHCDIVIPSGIGYARNLTNVLSGDAVIAFGGKSGTLSEIAYAWQFGKPVITCIFAGGWSEKIAGEPLDDRPGKLYPARNLDEVYGHLEEILSR